MKKLSLWWMISVRSMRAGTPQRGVRANRKLYHYPTG